VRISVEHLDTLMNLVGELVTDRTHLVQLQDSLRVRHSKDPAVSSLGTMAAHFSRVVDQLQQEVMQARMLPIAHLFDKFPRVARDLARSEGKQVNLVIEGAATELDRSVIEAIGDPLIHLLRNAISHGIEQPHERHAANKPQEGTVRLTAAHEEGHIVITMQDDGRGIDPAKIRQAAVEREVISQEKASQLDDNAAISLIFQPNLSTAGQVTEVAGRGVGLDVVLTNVKRLNGSVMVESEVGRGTTFRLVLPLTLAIMQAMLVGVGNDVYAVPMTGIVEVLYHSDISVSSVKGRPVTKWRDQVLPLVSVRKLFNHAGLAASPNGREQAIVIVSWGKLTAGLLVDRLIGKQEIVIKSLSPIIGNVAGVSGCAVLGDGSVVLIVDVPGLIGAAMHTAKEK
jgi:two-component system chemotaxis sensor kinase CheA